MYVCLRKQPSEGTAVCMCVINSSSIKFPADSYLYVNVMKELVEVFTRDAPRAVCVFVHARSSVGMDVYVFVILHQIFCRQLATCMCM